MMKKFYMAFLFLSLLLFQNNLYSQDGAILLNDNAGLSGTPFNGRLVLSSAVDSTIWTSNGTPGQTLQLSSTIKGASNEYGVLNGYIYFSGYNSPGDCCELWKTDGTLSNTSLEGTIWTGGTGSRPDNFVTFNNSIYFSAYTPSLGRELYQYSGSGSPTLVADLNPGGDNGIDSLNTTYIINNGRLLFNATNSTGQALYSAQSSSPIKILDFPNGYDLQGNSYAFLGNETFFILTDGAGGLNLYKTDGTVGGTSLLKSFSGGFGANIVSDIVSWNGKVFLSAAESGFDQELWMTDGTTTQLLKDINPGSTGSFPILFNSVVLKGRLFFTANTDNEGLELWSTDGTTAGTSLFLDINTNGNDGSNPFLMPVMAVDPATSGLNYSGEIFNRTANYNGYIFFSADDGDNDTELWKTDGTVANTSMVKDINNGGDGVGYSYIYTKSGIVFSGDDGTNGTEPWISDGTEDGTKQIAEINDGGDSDPEFLFIWNGNIYLTADNGNGNGDDEFDFYKLEGTYSSLPIILENFKATALSNSVLLNWKTASESNSGYFEILRSSNGENFTPIGRVTASGNSTTTKNYSFTDNDAYRQGVSQLYYRLSMVDKDGKSSLSKIELVTLNGNPISIMVYPNPATNVLQVRYNSNSESSITITDLNGRRVYNKKVSGSANVIHTINISSLPRGSYILRFNDGSKTVSKNFIKE